MFIITAIYYSPLKSDGKVLKIKININRVNLIIYLRFSVDSIYLQFTTFLLILQILSFFKKIDSGRL